MKGESELIWGRCRSDVTGPVERRHIHNFIERDNAKRRKCRGPHGGHGHMLYQLQDFDILEHLNDSEVCPVCLQMLRDEGVLPKVDELAGRKKKAAKV
ncbi:MAG TPA: hypothetical protein PLO06_11240 [Methanoregulaceae archaeon]|nr:hypothetical protein [Methanoregulaceae archaeon]